VLENRTMHRKIKRGQGCSCGPRGEERAIFPEERWVRGREREREREKEGATELSWTGQPD
jgi:hypothetical protein